MSEIEAAIAKCRKCITDEPIDDLNSKITEIFEEIRIDIGIEDERFGEMLDLHMNENDQYGWLYQGWRNLMNAPNVTDLTKEEMDEALARLAYVRKDVFSILEIEHTDENIEKTNTLCALTLAKCKISKLKSISLGVKLDNDALDTANFQDEEEKLRSQIEKSTSEAQELLDEIEKLVK